MSVEDALRNGRLELAYEEQTESTRSDPSNVRHRIAQFELLALRGEWDRALTQLDVVEKLDPGFIGSAAVYRSAVACEKARAAVFSGETTPVFFGDPEPWMAHLAQALKLIATGKPEAASPLRNEAFESAPASAGSLAIRYGSDEVRTDSFTWIADADSRLGPILEAIVEGRYFWVPFHRLREVRITPASSLRDIAWMPAEFTWTNGGENPGFIPTRYVQSEHHEADAVRLARETRWEELPGEANVGFGQRMFVTDRGYTSLLDLRVIHLHEG